MELKTVKIAAAQYPISFFTSFDEWIIKTRQWVDEAVNEKAKYLLFPEYGAMELTSLLAEENRQDLSQQALLLKPFLDKFIKTFKDLAQTYQVIIIAPSIPFYHHSELTTNRTFVFNENGLVDYQDKLFMTRFEDEQWNIKSGEQQIKIFQTKDFSFAISTCYDVEFFLPSLVAAHSGAEVIFAPSCTETIKGANRVHVGARARALENQLYVVVAQTIGQALWSPAVDENYGFSGVYTTPDVGFSDDGVLKIGEPQKETWLYADLIISRVKKVREHGAVFNYKSHKLILDAMTQNNSSLPLQPVLVNF